MHAAVLLNEEVAGLTRAVEVNHRYAEDAFQDGPMGDADIFVTRQDEPKGREVALLAFAVEGKPSAMHGVDVEEGGCLVDHFVGHGRKFLFA